MTLPYYIYIQMNEKKTEEMFKSLLKDIKVNNLYKEKEISEFSPLNQIASSFTEKEVIGKEIVGQIESDDMEKTAEFLRSFDGVTKLTYVEVPHNIRYRQQYGTGVKSTYVPGHGGVSSGF